MMCGWVSFRQLLITIVVWLLFLWRWAVDLYALCIYWYDVVCCDFYKITTDNFFLSNNQFHWHLKNNLRLNFTCMDWFWLAQGLTTERLNFMINIDKILIETDEITQKSQHLFQNASNDYTNDRRFFRLKIAI